MKIVKSITVAGMLIAVCCYTLVSIFYLLTIGTTVTSNQEDHKILHFPNDQIVPNNNTIAKSKQASPDPPLTKEEPTTSHFSSTWLYGKRIVTNETTTLPSSYVHNNSRETATVDIVSIGSIVRTHLQQVQAETWASHPSVRYFFGATEHDDADPHCHKLFTKAAMKQFIAKCRRTSRYAHSPIAQNMISNFANKEYSKKHPGWFCAQKRQLHAMGKLIRFYRKLQQQQQQSQPSSISQHATTTSTKMDVSLPDYMILLDDDTYFNMELFQKIVRNWDPSLARAEAGCLIKIDEFFSHPFGGFGLILSRGGIQNLMRPIFCQNTTNNNVFESNACQQLERNWFGEKPSFQEGMSISDLMDAHAARYKYYDKEKGSFPFCFHSDWIIGYYMNYFRISSHVTEFREESLFYQKAYDFHKSLAHMRTGWSLGIIYQNPKRNPPKNCANALGVCPADAEVCHHLSAEQMKKAYSESTLSLSEKNG